MDIVFSANNNEQVMVLPVVPPGLEFDEPQENEEFKHLTGSLNILGNMGLKTVGISSFFPVNKNYSFMKNGAEKDGWKYVEFFRKYRQKKLPFRVVITSKDGRELLNMPCSVDSFSYNVDKVGDIQYQLGIKEYPFMR